MSGAYEIVDEVRVGGNEQVASEWKTIRAVFPYFAELPSEPDRRTDSPVLKCHGLEWRIELFSAGDAGDGASSGEDAFVAVYLRSMSCTSTNKIRARFRIRIPSEGKAAEGGKFDIFAPEDPEEVANESLNWGHDIAKRKDVLDDSNNYLVDGNLTVDVDIQVMLDKPSVWTPTNTDCSDMLKLLDDTDNADVLFDIGQGSSGKKQQERQRPRTFYAHRNILSVRCPALAELAEGCDPEDPLSPKSATCE